MEPLTLQTTKFKLLTNTSLKEETLTEQTRQLPEHVK